jgi:hypothetical protein
VKKKNIAKQCEGPECTKKARIRFCSNKCKDRYHNLHNPRGKFAHLKEPDNLDEYHEHPLSSDGLGQY